MRTYLINGLFLYLLYAPGIIVKLGLRYVGFLKVLLSSAVNIIIMKLEGLHDAFLLVFQFHIQHRVVKTIFSTFRGSAQILQLL